MRTEKISNFSQQQMCVGAKLSGQVGHWQYLEFNILK